MLNIIAERGCRFIVGGRALAPPGSSASGGKMAAAAAAATAALSMLDKVNIVDGDASNAVDVVNSERSEGNAAAAAFDTMQSVLQNAPFPLPLELQQVFSPTHPSNPSISPSPFNPCSFYLPNTHLSNP